MYLFKTKLLIILKQILKKEPTLDFGGIYKAKIVSIVPGGIMVELFPNMKPALLPNNQLEGRKVSIKFKRN